MHYLLLKPRSFTVRIAIAYIKSYYLLLPYYFQLEVFLASNLSSKFCNGLSDCNTPNLSSRST